MPSGLPPLNALRAFEAAARHLSFRKAAAELNVTPAAISHQIKGLEDFIGTPLFRRLNRALLLTDAGQSILPGVRDGFASLAAALDTLRMHDQAGLLTVAVPPSFAAKWLLPRLEHFSRAHPEIDVRISSTNELVDYRREGLEIGVRYGTGHYPGLIAEHLVSDSVLPVCSPRLLESGTPLRTPADLRNFTLLHDDSHKQDETFPNWTMWLKAAGAPEVDASHGLRFDTQSAAQSAAVEGLGVTLGRAALLAGDIAEGRLVSLFDVVLPSTFAYYVVYTEASILRPKVALFRDWLIAEAQAG